MATKSKKKQLKFTIICPDLTEEKTESTTYALEVPSSSTTLHYKGQILDVTLEQFDILRVLGSGCYGTVSAVTIDNHPDVLMAVKKIVLESKEDRRASTYTDLTTIQKVGSDNYPYIISYYGAVIDRSANELLICVELMDASMDRFYQRMHAIDNLTENELNSVLCRLTHNITSALNFLKTRRILHRDVKPQNMLVNKESVFKLCDFGISRSMRASQSIAIGAVQGTEAYLPPELVGANPQPYGIRADMWALGLSLFEIIAGKHPFAQMSSFHIMSTIRNWTPILPNNRTISDEMRGLVLSLLKINLEERPKTYLEILEIPSVKAVEEMPSHEEQAFATRIIKDIPPFSY